MGKKEQIPARAIFVQGSLWVWGESVCEREVVFLCFVCVESRELPACRARACRTRQRRLLGGGEFAEVDLLDINPQPVT